MFSDIADELAKTLFEEAEDARFLCEPQSDRLVATNTAAARLTKFSQADLLKMPATYWFRFGDRGSKDWLREATNKSGVVHFPDGYFLRTQEIGVWIPVNLTVSRLDVQPQTLALISARDPHAQRDPVRAEMTERKHAEEELEKINSFLDSIVENVPIMLFVKDAAHLRFQLFNKAGENLLGYRRADLIGKNDYDFFPKQEADFFIQKDREVLDGKKLLDIAEEEIQTQSGIKVLHTMKIPILDEKGTPRYLLGISEDITERKRLRTLLAQNEKLASIGRLSAGMAHEINNPLAVVANNLIVLERDCKGLMRLLDTYEAQRERLAAVAPQSACAIEALAEEIDLPYIRANLSGLLQRTKEGLDRVTRIIHHLRGHARIAPIHRQEVSLPDLVETGLEMIQTRLHGRHIQVERTYNNPPKVRCVFTDINQVVQNLLINACQAIEAMPSSHAGRIGIAIRPEGEEMLIEVVDNGCGIAPEDLPRLFDPFFTTKDVRAGSGLGLWISHSIVSAHGGRIEVDSQLAQGCCFRVFLPFDVAEGQECPTPPV
jgi:PAS domain S-box-containing protein